MAKTTKTKKDALPPPATTPGKRTLEAHELVLSPMVQSAVGVQAWSKFMGEADLGELVVGLREQVEKVQGGDIKPIEAMLFGQAMTLQTIFTSLARRAVAQEHLKQFQTHLSLALKAQAQCRATLEALAEIKNPRPVAFVKQANISNGPQQVNNGTAPESGQIRAGAHPHAGEISGQQNGLLEERSGGGLERRGTQGVSGGIPEHAGARPCR